MLRNSLRQGIRALKYVPTGPAAGFQTAAARAPIFVNSRAPPAFLSQLPNQFLAAHFSTTGDDIPEATVVGADDAAPEIKPGTAEEHPFEAETKQLLDIVINSLYTDKEVFIRELVSNCSDALEKARHLQSTGVQLVDPETPLEIRITTDERRREFVVEDTGVGMTRGEMVTNLGTIARSGSKAFVKDLEGASAAGSGDVGASMIGQFGVGFYSAFMVADRLSVFSRSAVADNSDAPPLCWTSEGTGAYSISEAEGTKRGTRIVAHLRDDEASQKYSVAATVEEVLRKYSNFVPFPIYLNGERVNTVEAIWAMDKNSVTEEQYTEFYRYISSAYDEPMMTLHFRMDAPLDLKAVFFVGSLHQERFGMSRMEPGVNVYSRKVLLQAKSPDILPDWMRFVRGAVDSEDLPLSISREAMQDSSLVKKLNDVLSRRFIRHLKDVAKRQPELYLRFYGEYQQFLKEGVCSDHAMQNELARLLRFESSALPAGELTSFDEYIGRSPPEQKNIYYLIAPDRKLIEDSPYYEDFKRSGTEVLFMHTAIDDFIMNNLRTFNGRPFLSGESANVDLDKDGGKPAEAKDDASAAEASEPALAADEVESLRDWMRVTLGDRVSEVKVTTRLKESPAIIVDHESAAVRRMMAYVDQTRGGGSYLGPQKLAINPEHGIMRGLSGVRNRAPALAQDVAEQVFDNALMAAGLLDDARVMIPRLNTLLSSVLKDDAAATALPPPAADAEAAEPAEAVVAEEEPSKTG